MGMFSPVFVGSANVSEEDAERGAGTELHPSHTSNSSSCGKPGIFSTTKTATTQAELSGLQENPHARFCWSRREEQRCPLVFQGINPWQIPGNSSQTMDRGTFQAQSEPILLSPPYGKAPAVRNANSCPTKGNVHTVLTKVSQPLQCQNSQSIWNWGTRLVAFIPAINHKTWTKAPAIPLSQLFQGSLEILFSAEKLFPKDFNKWIWDVL